MYRYLASGFRDCLSSDLHSHDPINLYQIESIIRKLVPQDSSDIDKRTLENFLSMNERCKTFDSDVSDPAFSFVDKARFRLSQIFNNDPDFFINLESISEGMDLGPGANRKSHKSCSYLLKMATGLSGNQHQNRLVETVRDLYPAKLSFGPARHVVCGSSLSFVPKTAKSSRLICTEPTSAMLLQKGISAILERVLASQFGIVLSTQPDKQHALAKAGSIDGSFATIDLTSASDSIALSFCKYFLPARLFSWLCASRSTHTEFGGERYQLYMMSTMGNGWTFSLQTLIFSALAEACSDGLPFGVFGDDIIVHTTKAQRMLKVLQLCGFIPNPEKTFTSGSFRESCGADFLNGVNVRPFFIKNLRDEPDLCVVINSIRRWAATHRRWIPLTEGFINQLVYTLGLPSVPDVQGVSDDSGVKVDPATIPIKNMYVAGDPPRIGSLKNGSVIPCYSFSGYRVKSKRATVQPGTNLFQGAYHGELNRTWFNQPGVFLDAFLRGCISGGSMAFRAVDRQFIRTTFCVPLAGS